MSVIHEMPKDVEAYASEIDEVAVISDPNGTAAGEHLSWRENRVVFAPAGMTDAPWYKWPGFRDRLTNAMSWCEAQAPTSSIDFNAILGLHSTVSIDETQ
jgi:hypothetical protein